MQLLLRQSINILILLNHKVLGRKLDNPIDRYCINDRSNLKANDDGSVDIILSEDAPENTTNWLPVGDGGFHLYMRIYTPDMDALDTWTAPTITEIAPSNVN